MKKILAFLISILICTGVSFAEDRIALMYNVLPDADCKNNSVIDSRIQKELSFRLYSNQEPIYYNEHEIVINEGKFNIDITGMIGKQEIKFTNSENEEVTFTYYISDDTGLVKDYLLENEPVYIKTLDKIKLLYTAKDAHKIDYVISLIEKLPSYIKVNVKEIKLLPTNHISSAAGITDYNKITLYNVSSYTAKEIQRIITHEIAHTWAHELRKNKVIDYSYTDFEKAVKTDKNIVTNYSKNSLSEDFADSIAFYFADTKAFSKKFPARANYIKNLL